MMTQERALQLIQESLDSLKRIGLIEQDVPVRDDMVLLGSGSSLDSMAFVAFVSDLEDRLNQGSSQEIYLELNDMHEFSVGRPYLSAEALARYIAKLVGEQQEDNHG